LPREDCVRDGAARLLASTDPQDAELANGNYQVIVQNGVVTLIRKSQA
jgi:hypothetical protein